MAAINFTKALNITLAYEGGFSNHPADPGGATMKGVTQATYDAWRSNQRLPKQTVRNISEKEIHAIYKGQYWDLCQCDDLPSGVDAAVFDYAVNSGVRRAVQDLQRVSGSAADGIMGAKTLRAVEAMGSRPCITALCDKRLSFLKSLKTFKTFGKGWTKRVNSIRNAALELAAKPATDVHVSAVTASAKGEPSDVSVTRTTVGRGGIGAAVGAVGSAATEAAQQIAPYSETLSVLKWIFVILTIVGVSTGLYLTVTRLKRSGADG